MLDTMFQYGLPFEAAVDGWELISVPAEHHLDMLWIVKQRVKMAPLCRVDEGIFVNP